jgi:16S rRNA (uracil1498-N3)-methyltransferase
VSAPPTGAPPAGAPRAYVAAPLAADAEFELPAAVANHLVRVLRLRPDAALTLFDGRGGEYPATLLAASGRGARVRTGAHAAVERESPLRLTLLQGIARGERMDLILQKATELGVARLVPLACERSVVRLDAAQAAKRLEHWRAIAIAACEQCGRNRLPEIDAVLPSERIADAPGGAATPAGARTARLLLEPGAPLGLTRAAAGLHAVTLLVGPEGGLSERERALAARAGFTACSLGPRILRTETAPLAALAVLQALAGDLG